MARATERKAEKTREILDVPKAAQGVRAQLPLLRVRGAKSGPLVVVTAGQHGRELNGIAAIAQAFEQIDPEAVRGEVVFLPIMNPLGVRMHQQDYPFEHSRFRSPVRAEWNMNRTWRQTDARREIWAGCVAEHVWQTFLRHADLVLDLHGWASLSLAWALERDRKALLAFGLPWNMVKKKKPDPKIGYLESALYDAKIPSVTVELAPQNVLDAASVEYGRRGILNLLRYAGATKGRAELPPEQYVLDAAHEEVCIRAPQEGLVLPENTTGAVIPKGDPVLRLLSLDTLETVLAVKAPRKSLVFFLGGLGWGEDAIRSDVVYPDQIIGILKPVKKTIRHRG